MPAAFARTVRAPAQRQHSDKSADKRDRADPTDLCNISPPGESLQHCWHPKPKRVTAGVGKKQSHRQD